MAKIICCDNCNSTELEVIGEKERDRFTTTESGFWGLGGSYATDYIEHYKLYKQYKCKKCSYEFEELEYSR